MKTPREQGSHAAARNSLASLTIAVCLVAAMAARAQTTGPDLQNDVSIEQNLDAQISRELQFKDETGRQVALGDYMRDKPTILVMAYYECPNLCTQVLNGLVKSLRTVSFSAGDQFDVVVVSINPSETPELAASKKKNYLASYKREGGEQGWHFLVGDQKNIDLLAQTVGFRYVYDPTSKQYAHGAAIMVVTPDGRLSRYFMGIEFAPRDIKLALMDATEAKIGSLADQVLVLCFQYDPSTGGYSFATLRAMQAGGILTVVVLGLFMARSVRREKRNKQQNER